MISKRIWYAVSGNGFPFLISSLSALPLLIYLYHGLIYMIAGDVSSFLSKLKQHKERMGFPGFPALVVVRSILLNFS